MAAPAGPTSPGHHPVSVWLTDDYVQAAPGTGEAKCAGNYAASCSPRPRPPNSCDQVVWLDAAERLWIEEMGRMNLFFVYGEGPHAVAPPALTEPCCRGSPGNRCSRSPPTSAARRRG
ncbi:MAG: hypothetical protein H6525_05740 [Actinobacteria bacterium]|nr:hypothetical protein [Actinomycetota bacterium]